MSLKPWLAAALGGTKAHGFSADLRSVLTYSAKMTSGIKSTLLSTASYVADLTSPMRSTLLSTASYTGTLFSPASGNDANTVVLLHFDGTNGSTTMTDDNVGGNSHTWTAAGAAALSTTSPKFGTASLLNSTATSSAADYVNTPDDTDWHFGGSDFTIDCWFKRGGNLANYNMLFWWGTPTLAMYINTDDKIFIAATIGGGASTTGSTVITDTTTWHHVAMVRTGDNLKLFLDGVQDATTASVGTLATSAANFIIGNYSDQASFPFNGRIDEFRMSNVARWTSNFTPPAAPYS